MNILMVAANQEQSPFPVAPVGALCVTAAAQRVGHSVDFIDAMFRRNPMKEIRSALKSRKYEAVGFSIRNLDNCFYSQPKSYFEDVKAMVEEAIDLADAPVILGGSGFSIDPYGWLKRLKVQYGIVGDGEDSFVELLGRISAGRDAGDISGVLCNHNHGKSKRIPESARVADIDKVYLPAHTKCDYKRYVKLGGFVSLQTKRGCPFKCIYCVYPVLEGCGYRLRSPEHIAEEISSVVADKGVRAFYFTDSVFNTPRPHALAICREIARHRLSIKWMAYCNPLGFDLELARSMAEAGCVGVEFGLDVASEKMLEKMGKPFSQSEIRKCLKASSDAGLPAAVHLLFGGPGETVEDIRDTQRFLDSCATPNAIFALLGIRIYENTPIKKVAVEEGVISEDTDLFNPVYYVSTGLGNDPIRTLDEIARKRPEWSTPTDWSRLTMRLIQKSINRFGSHPQWLNIRNYGKYMRRAQEKV